MTGPSWTEQWTSWKYRTAEQTSVLAITAELERLLGHEKARKSQLSADELTTIKKNLQTQKLDPSDDLVSFTLLFTKYLLVNNLYILEQLYLVRSI